MQLLNTARRVKHEAYVARKNARRWALQSRARYFSAHNEVNPFRYRQSRYVDAHGFLPFDFFLHRDADIDQVAANSEVPNRLWCFWTGDNPLTPNRERALRSMRQSNPDLELTLVTPTNLETYVVDGSPLHPAYTLLSTNHRSDYLRAYFMHHYGGAYADIKPASVGLASAIEQVRSNPQLWVLGPNDPDLNLVGNLFGPVGRDTRRNHARIASVAAMVAWSHTPLTAEWLNEVERRVSYHARDLERNPATDPFGTEGKYPVTWIGLGADIFQPLQLKYLGHVRIDNSLLPSIIDYR